MPSADISLCARHACPLALQCVRSPRTAKPGYHQSWAMFGPVDRGWCADRIAPAADAVHGGIVVETVAGP